MDFLEDWHSLGDIKPMAIVNMLSKERNCALGIVIVKFGHIEVVDEVNEFDLSSLLWSVSVTLFDQLLLKHSL